MTEYVVNCQVQPQCFALNTLLGPLGAILGCVSNVKTSNRGVLDLKYHDFDQNWSKLAKKGHFLGIFRRKNEKKSQKIIIATKSRTQASKYQPLRVLCAHN